MLELHVVTHQNEKNDQNHNMFSYFYTDAVYKDTETGSKLLALFVTTVL